MAERELIREDTAIEARKFIAGVYGWMAIALIISGFAALFTAASPMMISMIWGTRFGFYVLLAIELLLVFILSASMKKLSAGVAGFFFILYSIINGITLSSIFIVFETNSIIMAFFISAGMFLGMTIYGRRTSQNLTSAGRYLMMAVIGLVIAALVNLLFKSSMLEWIISIVSVVVFIGLTAYDSQKIARAALYSDGSETFKKAAILGALELYLDFINIFLALLNLFGKKRS